MSHHWAYCLYPGVKSLHPLVTNFARRYTLRRMNTEYLLCQARDWGLRADRRGYLSYALALRWHTVDPKTLLPMLFRVHEEVPDADIETYILYVHYQCFHMPKAVVFPHQLRDVQRVDVRCVRNPPPRTHQSQPRCPHVSDYADPLFPLDGSQPRRMPAGVAVLRLG